MSRLPTPGSDAGSWGKVLNDFLSVELNGDGTLKRGSDISAALTRATDAQSSVSTLTSSLAGKLDTSIATTKGDLLAATAANTVARVGVGSNGQVLTADTTATPGVKWATPATAPVTSVVGQTGAITGPQIAADSALTGAFAGRLSAYDCLVDAAGSGTHTDLASAITACPIGGTIRVISDLTVSPAAGTVAFTIPKQMTIDFRGVGSGKGVGGRRVINTGDGDVFASSIALNTNGQVNGVEILGAHIAYTGAATATLSTGLALSASGDTVTATAHGLPAGKQVRLSNIVSATGVVASITYYVVSPTANTFKLALGYGDNAVNITADGTADVTVLGRSAGRAFQMHGAFQWRIDSPYVTGHAVAMFMDSSPYPSGQCSHNMILHAHFNANGQAVKNTNAANINTWLDSNFINNDTAIDHTDGLNPRFISCRIESLNGYTGTQIRVGGPGLLISGLHCEGQAANPALSIDAGSQGTIIDGDIYVTTGVTYAIDSGSTTRYALRLKGVPYMERSYTRAQYTAIRPFEGLTVTTTRTVMAAVGTMQIRGFSLCVGDFVAYAASDFWSLAFYEYNGNVLVGQIGTTIVQAAQWGLGPIKQTLATPYQLITDRTIRATFTKAGAAAAIGSPVIQVEWQY